jgi:hypothetical protein
MISPNESMAEDKAEGYKENAAEDTKEAATKGDTSALAKLAAEVREKIVIPEELRDAYRRLLTAGLNIMYQKKTSSMMIKTITAQGDVSKNVGEGAAGLVLLLYKQSKGAPGKLAIPIGMEFTLQAFEFIEKTKMVPYTMKDVGVAIKIMIEVLLRKSGANMQAFDKAIGQKSTQTPPMQTPAPVPPQPAGMISQGGR